MDTALTQKFLFISDRNLAKANCTGNRVCTSCDIVVLDPASTHVVHECAVGAPEHELGRVCARGRGSFAREGCGHRLESVGQTGL